MFKSISFRLFKTTIHLHWSLLIFLGIYLIPCLLKWNVPLIIFNLKAFLTVFTLVTIHEFGHIFTLRHFGYVSDEVYLNLFGGVADVKTEWTKPKHLLLIALAGPATNLVMFLLTLPFVDITNHDLTNNYLLYFCVLNFIMFAYNLLPITPMDGGHVTTSIFWFKTKSKEMAKFYAAIFAIIISAIVICIFIIIEAYLPILLLGLFTFLNITVIREGLKLKKVIRDIKDMLLIQLPDAKIKVNHINDGETQMFKALINFEGISSIMKIYYDDEKLHEILKAKTFKIKVHTEGITFTRIDHDDSNDLQDLILGNTISENH